MEILIIDDSEVCCLVLQKRLEKIGLKAIYVMHGKQAIPTVQQIQPRLIILDIYIPTIDGFEINRELQKLQNTPYIIAISKDPIALECIKYLGADEIFIKDDIDLIIQAVKVFCMK